MEEKIKKIIEENPIAIATCNKNCKPNISVAAFAKIKDDKIIITNNYMVATIENIKQNPRVNLAVWNKSWEGYKIEGEAEYSCDNRWIEFIKSIKQNKGEPCHGAIIIKIINLKKIGD